MRTAAARLALALAAALSAPAASAQEFRCPDRGGPAWREVRTPHFVVWTDLSSGKARELASELERLHEVIRHGLFRTPREEPGVTRVVALRSEDEFGLFADRNSQGFFAQTVAWGPTLVLPDSIGDQERALLAHELTHALTSRVFARQPTWFSEGVACYMETVGTSGPEATPTVGGVPKWRYKAVFPYHGGIGAVLSAQGNLLGGDRDDVARRYGLAWALVHFLVNRHPQELAELQARFARGEDPATAWREVFPRWDPAVPKATEDLDDAIGRYLASGSFGYRPVQLPPEPPVAERPLTAADAHDARLSLPWRNRGEKVPPERLRAEVDEALAHDPGCVAALSALARERPREATALAERATAAHPGDVRAWLLLAHALPKDAPARREAALRKAVEADPASPVALNGLAWQLLANGRSGEALPLARRAAFLAPWSAPTLDTLSGVLEDLGQCAEALAVERRALDVLPESTPEKGRAAYLDRTARLDRQCGARPAAAGAAPAPSPPSAAPPSR